MKILPLALAARVEEEITFDWLKSHSPVEIPDNNRACGELLLNELYPTGSRILVFTAFASQGQYMYVVGDGAYKLGPETRRGARESPQAARWRRFRRLVLNGSYHGQMGAESRQA